MTREEYETMPAGKRGVISVEAARRAAGSRRGSQPTFEPVVVRAQQGSPVQRQHGPAVPVSRRARAQQQQQRAPQQHGSRWTSG
jgi:hypothetical protein